MQNQKRKKYMSEKETSKQIALQTAMCFDIFIVLFLAVSFPQIYHHFYWLRSGKFSSGLFDSFSKWN